MSKALAVLKLFFSMVSINSTAKPAITSPSRSNTTLPITQATQPIPLLLTPMDQIASFVGQGFRFKIPDDTFYPTYYVGRRQNLKLSMFTINGGKISPTSWLRFDSEERNIYGFPLAGNEGRFQFQLKATNSDGKFAEDTVGVHVRKSKSNHNHEFVIRTRFHLLSFVSDVMVRYDFVSRLARYAIDDEVGSVWIKSQNRKQRQITFTFNTIPYSSCDKSRLQSIYNKLATSSGGVNPSFQKALSDKFPISSVGMKFFGPCIQKEKEDDNGFEWGILKHLMPILMLMFVIGIPVGISVAIHKRIKKKRAKLRDERKRRRRMENGTDFTFHTVHYNNRYPSMLSVSNNSKEEDATEDEASSKINIIPNGTTPNGTIPSNLAVPNTGTNKQTNNKLNTNRVNLEGKQTNSSGSRVVYMGKSDMNIPVYFTKPKEEIKNDQEMSFSMIAETISSTLKGIGKSVLNVAGQEEEGTTANDPKTVNLDGVGNKSEKDNKLKLLASELELPLATEKDDVRKLQTVSIVHEPAALGIPQRSQSELKLTDYGKGNSVKEDGKIPLMNSASSRLPKRRVSLPHIEMHSGNTMNKNQATASLLGNTPQGSNNETGEGISLKSLLKSLTDISKATPPKEETVVREETPISMLTSQLEQMSKEAREDFGSGNEVEVIYSTEDYGMQQSEENLLEHDERYEEEEEELMAPEDIEAMDYTTWRMRQIKKAQKAAEKKAKKEQGMGNTEYNHEYSREDAASTDELVYQDYTNPYQYANASCLSVKTQSLHLTSQSSGLNWSDDYEKENCYKQQRPVSPMYSPNTQSMPSLNDRRFLSPASSTKMDNRSKAQEENQQEEKSILGKIFSREKPEESKNLNQTEEPEEGSLVGFLKTRVGGLLGPSEGSSWFK